MRSLRQEVQNQIPHISLEENFNKYFRYARMTSLNISKV